MKNIGTYLLVGLGVLIAVGLVAGYFIFGSLDSDVLNRRTLLIASLAAKKDEYAKCYNSINYGTVMVGDVSIRYLYDHDVNRLHEIEDSFMTQVKQKCDTPVATYEADFKELSSLDEKITQETSWKSFLVGGSNPPGSYQVKDLEPSNVRFSAGNPFSNFIFTKDEVEKYFQDSLAT